MASNDPNSPRQKMINLMYLVFIAMLALNVSSEVLDGFELVEESLLRSVKSSSSKNDMVFQDLIDYHESNPEKTEIWYERARQVKEKSDSLFNYTQELKLRITKSADGDEGDPENLKRPDDLNAAYEVMFEKGKNDGRKLRESIDNYRDYVLSLVTDTTKKNIIESNLSTDPSNKAKENNQSWEESMFWQMPLAAAVTMLTKMQNDIRYAEGEVLSDLLRNIDVTDFRVNKVEAFVIPQSQVVIRGGSYSADIVLSAQDSTQRPRVFVNGKFLPEEANGKYLVGTGSTGTFPVSGYIEMNRGDGSMMRKEFSTEYFVVEPNASVSPTLMNVLYAGYENPIEIAVPGVPSQNVSASMTNGTLTPKGNNVWVAVPSKIGTDAVISVTARIGNNTQEMAKKTLRVRALPPPLAYLEYADANGNPTKFRGGRIPKATLVGINGIKAAIDDDLLRIGFTVLKFETSTFDSMGNRQLEVSNGSNFSQRQKDLIRGMARGKVFYIREVVAVGPDKVERTLDGALEIIVN